MVRKNIINIILILISFVGYSQHNFFFNQHYGISATINVPIVTTTTASSVGQTSTSVGGNVTNDGGSTVTRRGVAIYTNYYEIRPYYDTPPSYIHSSGGTGIYSGSTTSLQPNTLYYYQAWAENSAGIGWGDLYSFTTLPTINIPTVTTSAITNIGITTATGGGNVTADGGSSVIARGVCWNITGNPSISDTKTSNANGTGVFTSSLTGLTPGQTYYVRAYAINSSGTAYGSEVSFVTQSIVFPEISTNYAFYNGTLITTSGSVISSGNVSITGYGMGVSATRGGTYLQTSYTSGDLSNWVVNYPDLNPSGNYYMKAYVTTPYGTVYGNVLYYDINTEVVIVCDNSATYSGGITYGSAYNIQLGATIGLVELNYLPYSPVRIVVWLDGIIFMDTGYRTLIRVNGEVRYNLGGSLRPLFNGALFGKTDPITGNTYPDMTLSSDGYPEVYGDPLPLFIEYKGTATTRAVVKVYAPLDTNWTFTLGCPFD